MDIKALDKAFVGEVWTSPDLYRNLEALCNFGSRFAGSPGEIKARDFIVDKFHEYKLAHVRLEPFEYLGWWRGTCGLNVVTPIERSFDAISLVYSPSTPEGGLLAPLVDVGMGTEKEYAEHPDLKGKVVLCSSANPEEGYRPHRREKYGRAVDGGAVGFVYARHLPGGLPETGSLRPGRLGEIPAVAVSYETGFALKRLNAAGQAVVRLNVQNDARPTTAWHVLGQVPGRTPETILVGAHYDAHDISQGAMDNASGVCLVLEMARLFAPLRGQLERTLCFWGIACEELGVLGSTRYVETHAQDLSNIALMVNLDGSVGDGRKGFAYGGLTDVAAVLKRFAKESGYELRLSERLETASDHFPFFMAGTPAIMMTAKEENRALGRGYGHTPFDTLDKVSERDLKESAMVAARVLLSLAAAAGPIARRRSPEEVKAILVQQGLEAPLRAQGKWPFG